MREVLLLEANPDVPELVRMALELRGYVVPIPAKPECTLRCVGPEGSASCL